MEFITFEMAKKLKEKGYPFNTSHHYDKDGHIIVALCDCDERCEYPMPEIHQVLKWLREAKNIEVVASFSYGNKVWGYQVGDMSLSEDSILAYDYSFPTYEQAALTGIEYVLDNKKDWL